MPDADEDHLRVALIQPGSSRYEQMSGSYFLKIIAIRVEPRVIRPLQIVARDFYFATIQSSIADAISRMEVLNSLENNKKENENGKF